MATGHVRAAQQRHAQRSVGRHIRRRDCGRSRALVGQRQVIRSPLWRRRPPRLLPQSIRASLHMSRGCSIQSPITRSIQRSWRGPPSAHAFPPSGVMSRHQCARLPARGRPCPLAIPPCAALCFPVGRDARSAATSSASATLAQTCNLRHTAACPGDCSPPAAPYRPSPVRAGLGVRSAQPAPCGV
jgi:hypothetical protein